MKILSLFDGMACGMLAMMEAGVEVSEYHAFEIDTYATKTSSHNFPMIQHHGDVFKADFTEFAGFDYLIGGSPCTYWSIAQKNNRETEASGMGWELFSQYVRALHEAKPKFFIYENNKSMSKAIRASIDEAFGFEAICINSALVSAQNRQRLYWVGRRNPDGTYSKVSVDQPEDRGILLKDILENGNCKAEAVGVGYRNRREEDGKLYRRFETHGEAKANALTTVQTDSRGGVDGLQPSLQDRIYSIEGKHTAVTTAYMPKNAEPVRVGSLPRPTGELSTSQAFRVYSVDGKSVNITAGGGGAGGKTGLYAVPLCNMPVREATKKGYTEIEPMECVDMTQPNSKTRRGSNMADKSNCCMTSCQHYQYCGVLCYATPCEWDAEGNVTKAISAADGKTYAVYKVENGEITIKGRGYPIKLADGFYIIRKLTVRECMRLQTVPEWYEFPASDTQAYKMLGNGWTVSVISHLIEATKEEDT